MGHDLQHRLNAFVNGEYSLNDFVEELFVLCDASPESAWEILALIDQYYRRGKLSADLFRTIKNRIEQHVLGVPDSDSARAVTDGPSATESLVGAVRSGTVTMVATHEQTAGPKEPASEFRAPRIEPPMRVDRCLESETGPPSLPTRLTALAPRL